MILLNFSHPLTEEQLARIRELTGQDSVRVIEIKTQFDNDRPFGPQLEALVGQIPLDGRELQTVPILIVPPALNFIAVMLLAHLHGRMGYFPPVVRLRPVEGSIPRRFEVAEIL
ncbi:MAG: hypothetical protein GXP38_03815, partial [Chloroflexi bacterium]|nr:hypothetical protein [Chloroflexota bacterium]